MSNMLGRSRVVKIDLTTDARARFDDEPREEPP
jgi:hypothetical protein